MEIEVTYLVNNEEVEKKFIITEQMIYDLLNTTVPLNDVIDITDVSVI